jgi:hypothetical protein
MGHLGSLIASLDFKFKYWVVFKIFAVFSAEMTLAAGASTFSD